VLDALFPPVLLALSPPLPEAPVPCVVVVPLELPHAAPATTARTRPKEAQRVMEPTMPERYKFGALALKAEAPRIRAEPQRPRRDTSPWGEAA